MGEPFLSLYKRWHSKHYMAGRSGSFKRSLYHYAMCKEGGSQAAAHAEPI